MPIAHKADTAETRRARGRWREPTSLKKPWMAAPKPLWAGVGAGAGEVAAEGFTHHRLGGQQAQLTSQPVVEPNHATSCHQSGGFFRMAKPLHPILSPCSAIGYLERIRLLTLGPCSGSPVGLRLLHLNQIPPGGAEISGVYCQKAQESVLL